MKDSSSPYYAGLNLVAIGSLAFLPWKSYFMWLTFLALYGPYYLIYFYLKEETPTAVFLTNSFFILGTVFIAFVIRHFNENLRLREVKSRVKLEDEVEHRNEIIDQKTKQAVSLTNLSKQFSPQVVNSIENGKIKLEADVHRAKICSIFIDIVNSTERITRLEKDKVHKVISMFMEDTNKILLKYDITIDKFLGDGILAFCNDPIQYNDYAERVVRAALEIQERVRQRQFLYENYWLNQLELRMGIAIGDANVGFYGSQKYYHSYTAIGPVINLASRLCGAAKPNQIVMSYDVLEAINFEDYEIEPIGKLSLKGFEQDVINAYSLLGARKQNQVDVSECPTCGNIMHLEQNQKGIYIFVCRSCGSELDEKGTLESPYQKNSA